jgi:hypothetical protein
MGNSRYFSPAHVRRIGERCGWVCGICGESIDPLLRYPDPASRSVDHTLPTQYGGGEEEGNLRIAHLCCNTRDGWAWHIGERNSFSEALAWANEMRRTREPQRPRPPRPLLAEWWPDDDNRFLAELLMKDQPDAEEWLD